MEGKDCKIGDPDACLSFLPILYLSYLMSLQELLWGVFSLLMEETLPHVWILRSLHGMGTGEVHICGWAVNIR